jgi:Holliday junction DNA helicase RuvA
VQGVGARVALAILSVLEPDELSQAIVMQDKAAIGRASGVGKKLAERVVNELKDKVGGLAIKVDSTPAPGKSTGVSADAISALTNLGYRPVEASAAVARAARSLGSDADLQALIKAGLKELAR